MIPTEMRKLAVYRMDPALIDGLHQVKERDGLPITWQVQQAIRAWLDSKGVATRAATGRSTPPQETLTVNLL